MAKKQRKDRPAEGVVETAVAESQKIDLPDGQEERLNKTLAEAKEKFVDVVVVGLLPDGNIDVLSSTPSFKHIHHLMNRAEFELLLFEKSLINQRNSSTT